MLVKRAHLVERSHRPFVSFLYKSPRRLQPSCPLHLMPFPLLHLTVNPTSLSAMTAVDSPQSITVTSPTRSSAPSTPTSSTPPSSSPKRRRQDEDTTAYANQSSATGTGPIRTARKDKDVPRKKKAARACIHCQRAHLTCDDCVYPLILIRLILANRNCVIC